MAFILAPLPYAFDALEPYIDARTMELHYTAHHAGYVAKLNAALETYPELMAQPLEDLVRNYAQFPEAVRLAVRNQAGGHYNHTFFWSIMTPNGIPPSDFMMDILKERFQTLEAFKIAFNAKATTVFGSGWAWLCVAPNNTLEIVATPNQDSPITNGLNPVVGLDVWEHAYYLKYQSKRPSYIDAWWHVVDWAKVEELYCAACK